MPYLSSNNTNNDNINESLSSINHTVLNDDDRAAFITDYYVIPIILLVGVLGNTLCLLGFRNKRLRHGLNQIEQEAISGLICLASSDLFFCIIGSLSIIFPASSFNQNASDTFKIISFYYDNYRTPMLNIFLICSTWLIVIIAVHRYKAVADPFNVKYTNLTTYKTHIYCSIFALSLLITVPQFLNFRIHRSTCSFSCYCFYRVPGLFTSFQWYLILWHISGTLIPAVILFFCHYQLVRRMYRSLHESVSQRYSTSKITIILILIVTLFLVLMLSCSKTLFFHTFLPQQQLCFYHHQQVPLVIECLPPLSVMSNLSKNSFGHWFFCVIN